ncbi:AAA family ATPase [Pseudomonas fildesensis]|uniref:Chromosome segregation protein SMC n=1 Tax=Pseudomonas fildesensis TaxID=1674920 RepID=A0A0J8IWT8_9PSED|nr:AAA family ATPase [Pseudomonas fildesensis]KMT56396.1 chromosome segregation protein SMC [Pseudomonas fildesensis]
MIKTIVIKGFKSIPELTLELGRVNCFIGANGVGKSNILEALGVLGAAANGVVDSESLTRRGVRDGLPRLFKTSFTGTSIRPEIHLSAKGQAGEEYRTSILNPIEKPESAWSFKTEYLRDEKTEILTSGVRSSKNMKPTAGLAALKLVDLPPENLAGKLMQNLQDYAIYSPNTPSLRATVADPQTRIPLGLAGGRLAEAFDELKSVLSSDPDLMDSVLELIDWVVDIDAVSTAGSLLSPSVPRGQRVLKLTDRFMRPGRNTLTAYDASEGALYVLFSAILCLSPTAPMVVAIDNLDQALNPRLAMRLTEKLAYWLRVNDAQRQLLFTTHNPAVLDGLDLSDDEIRLFAVDRNSEGHTSVTRIAPTEKLLEMNKNYPLSRLWMMGHLGALPNV